MPITIDELQVNISASASQASNGIDALTKSLTTLKTSIRGGAGLTTTSKQLTALSASLATISAPGTKIKEVVSALAQLGSIGKSNLGTTLNQLKKLPEITKSLEATDMGRFAIQIQQVVTAVRPLATEMEKVSLGFSKLPANIQRAINANAKLTTSNRQTSKSYGILGLGISATIAKFSIAFLVIRRVMNVLGDWISESNAYVENLNLFTVAMGEYATASQDYAEAVGDLLGIDPSTWMRQQGIFMTLATGFGVASEAAAKMSKNLTQLGYDLSSFFNISVEDAMQKVQSGLAGELEPLRRLGYDLSQAKLQAIALSLGIDKSVASMNQAEKSQLRYYAIMTQVTTAQGDMARTITSPANQLRILAAQATQAARALGNIFIPALNAILPYAIAFLKVIRMVADSIASLFGFSLPEFDYSGLEGISSAVDDDTSSLESATDAANAYKKSIMGFDELNVLSSTTASAGSVGDTDVSDFNIELPEYDFLGPLEAGVDTIKEKMIGFFEDWKGVIETIGTALLIAFVGDKLITGISNLTTHLTTLKTNGLGGVASAILGAAGLVAAFLGAKNGAEGLATYLMSGDGSLASALTSLVVGGVGATVAGFAIGGPIGAVIGGLAFLAGAISGVFEAVEKERGKTMLADFFDGEGIAIENLTSDYTTLCDTITTRTGVISGLASEIDTLRSNTGVFADNIHAATLALGTDGPITEEEIGKIKGYFDSLYENIKLTMENSAAIIMTSLSDALKGAAPELAKNIDNLIGEYQRFVRETQGRGAELQLLIDNAYDSLIGETVGSKTYDETMEQITSYYEELGALSNTMTEAAYEWKTSVDTFSNTKINFGGNIEETQTFLSGIATAAENALLGISEARKTAMIELESQIAYAQVYMPEQVDMLLNIKKSLTESYDRQEQDVKDGLMYIFYQLDSQFVSRIEEVKDNAQKAWNDMSWLEKGAYGWDEDKYVAGYLRDFEQDVASPLLEQITTVLSKMGIETDGFAPTMIDNIVSGLLDLIPQISYEVTPAFVKELPELLPLKDLEKTGADAAGNIATGLSNSAWKIKNAYKGIMSGLKFKTNVVTGFSTGGASITLEPYATGGLPSTGELFMAREAGPELVGRMGSRTAVANNDQIVEGVAAGVAKAIAQSGGNSGQTSNAVIQVVLNDKVVGESFVAFHNGVVKQTGKSPLRV